MVVIGQFGDITGIFVNSDKTAVNPIRCENPVSLTSSPPWVLASRPWAGLGIGKVPLLSMAPCAEYDAHHGSAHGPTMAKLLLFVIAVSSEP
jgi:hypothetical protein